MKINEMICLTCLILHLKVYGDNKCKYQVISKDHTTIRTHLLFIIW